VSVTNGFHFESTSSRCDPSQIRLPCGLILVDADSLIISASEPAREILGSASGLESRDGQLRVERAGVDRELRALIRGTATKSIAINRHPRVMGVPDRDGRTRYAIRVLLLEETAGAPLVQVAIADLLKGPQVQRTELTAIFRLSEREAELTQLFSSGLSVDEIALRMGVTVNTAKVHLHHVFEKTGCGNQVELARILAFLTSILC
jgi:DNA-binding CsgD family transcriptional regulator